MAISLVAGTSVSNGTATQTLVLTCPTGTASGDVMIATVACPNSPAATTITAPSGWTTLSDTLSVGSLARGALYRRVADGTDTGGTTTYTWTFVNTPTTTVKNSGGIETYAGVDTTTPEDVAFSAQTASSQTVVVHTGVTTATDGAWLIGAAFGDFSTSASFTAPGTMTERYQTTARRTSMADEARATAGATGSRTWAVVGATGAFDEIATLGALRPAATGPPAPPPVQGVRVWQPRYRRIA